MPTPDSLTRRPSSDVPLAAHRGAQTFIEPLETRIAPAAVFTFTDVDGDAVKITSSLGTNTDLAAAVTVVGGQLRVLDLTDLSFQGTSITASVVTKSATGDGLVNIGRINAGGRDLGSVTIKGDLGAIDAGDGTLTTAAIKLLSVRSMGRFSTVTQGGVGDLRSDFLGAIGALVVTGDFVGASIRTDGGTIDARGGIGSVTIGGSFIGADTGSVGEGSIFATGDIGPVKIGRDFIGGAVSGSGAIFNNGSIQSVTIGGSFLGGPSTNSGRIFANARLGPVLIGGDLIGGAGAASAFISTDAEITSVRIGGSVLGGLGQGSAAIISPQNLGPVTIGGNIVGGANSSAEISTGGKLASVTIGGSLIGGAGSRSGGISGDGGLGPVKIGHDVKGGAGNESGKIDSGGSIDSLAIGGSLLGAGGSFDTIPGRRGQIFAEGSIGPIRIGGDVLGASGPASGTIRAGNGGDPSIRIASVVIGGSLVGGSGTFTGVIESAGHLGPVTIRHSIVGGSANSSGGLTTDAGDLASVTIGGSLVGGAGIGSLSGFLYSRGNIGTVLIKGDFLGGAAESSGYVLSLGKLDQLIIGGSFVGGAAAASGVILVSGAIGAVRIGHDLLGGSIPAGTASLDGSGYIDSGDRIGSVFIGGSIISGTDGSSSGELSRNATIRAGRDIGALTVRGGLIGNVTPNGDSPVIVSAFGKTPVAGATTDVAIGKISIGGRVEWAQIFAGYDVDLVPQNADAQIGAVTVGADWIASSLVAGAINLGQDQTVGGTGANADNVKFGDLSDRKISEAGELPNVRSRISSIVIAGQVFGTPDSFRTGDQFGFVAEQIVAFKVGARTSVLEAGPGNDGIFVHSAVDLTARDSTLHEVAFAGLGTSPITFSASAKLVNASTVTYLDTDGDKVTVKLSKPMLTTEAIARNVFRFDTGQVDDSTPALQQLRSLDLRPLQSNGLGVTVTVVRAATGDGLVNIGAILSAGYDVGAVKIPGDLGQIDAGDANLTTPGVASLSVRTLGRFGLDTQGPQSIASLPDLQSDIVGRLGALTVRQDIVEAFVNVSGTIGPVTIGGSLVGGASSDSGAISATGRIDAVKIGHHMQGGSGTSSGQIDSQTSIGSLAIGGSLLGASGNFSAAIGAYSGPLGAVTIGHNVRGGTGGIAGDIYANGNISSMRIGGSVLGGLGNSSARLVSDSAIGPVTVGHNVLGGAGSFSGRISGSGLGAITLGGSLIGGAAASSGNISSGTGSDIGPVKIGHELLGGAGADSGQISAGRDLKALTIGGSLLGGVGARSGEIIGRDTVGPVKIGENLVGGAGVESGRIFSPAGKIVSTTIGGSLVGGTGNFSGEIRALGDLGPVGIAANLLGGAGSATGRLYTSANLASLSVGGSLIGGSGGNSAQIYSSGDFRSLSIRGSFIGGAGGTGAYVDCVGQLGVVTIGGSFIGGPVNYSGNINGVDGIASVTLGRNLIGGSISGTASSVGAGLLYSEGGRIGSVTIGGSIFAGSDASTGTITRSGIRAADDIGAIVVRGSLHGSAASPVIISAVGEATPTATRDTAIKSLSVGGSVGRALILGGYGTNVTAANTPLAFTNNDAQIGAVSVGGNWTASSLVAGVRDLGNNGFGNGDDDLGAASGAIARIASVVIGGGVSGTPAAGDHFGFSSVSIGSFKAGLFTAPLSAATDPVIPLTPLTGDVSIREV